MTSTSLNNSYGRYVHGGNATINNGRIGFWERQTFPRDDSDIVITLESQYHNRPWLLAYDFYKDVKLTWFVLQYNTILDIDIEFVTGATVVLPTPHRLKIGLMSKVI